MIDARYRIWPQRLLVGAVVAAVISITSTAPAAQSDSSRELKAVLEKSLALLEGKQYGEFFKTFVRPSELEELMTKFGTLEKVTEAYGQTDRPARQIEVLKGALSVEPTLSADGSRATYTFTTPVGRERGVSLQKIDGRWYLRN